MSTLDDYSDDEDDEQERLAIREQRDEESEEWRQALTYGTNDIDDFEDGQFRIDGAMGQISATDSDHPQYFGECDCIYLTPCRHLCFLAQLQSINALDLPNP